VGGGGALGLGDGTGLGLGGSGGGGLGGSGGGGLGGSGGGGSGGRGLGLGGGGGRGGAGEGFGGGLGLGYGGGGLGGLGDAAKPELKKSSTITSGILVDMTLLLSCKEDDELALLVVCGVPGSPNAQQAADALRDAPSVRSGRGDC
jgi:hypothetical protein